MEELRFVNLVCGNLEMNSQIISSERMSNNLGHLGGLSKTVAIIADADKFGYDDFFRLGLSNDSIHLSRPANTSRIKQLMDLHRFNYFHLLDWSTNLPDVFCSGYRGIASGMGFFNRSIYGKRSLDIHLRFCRELGTQLPFPVYCRRVGAPHDEISIIYMEEAELSPDQNVEAAYLKLKSMLAQVQIEGRRRLAKGNYIEKKLTVPARSADEMNLFERLKLDELKSVHPA